MRKGLPCTSVIYLSRSLLQELNNTKTNIHYHILKAEFSSKFLFSDCSRKTTINKKIKQANLNIWVSSSDCLHLQLITGFFFLFFFFKSRPDLTSIPGIKFSIVLSKRKKKNIHCSRDLFLVYYHNHWEHTIIEMKMLAAFQMSVSIQWVLLTSFSCAILGYNLWVLKTASSQQCLFPPFDARFFCKTLSS